MNKNSYPFVFFLLLLVLVMALFVKVFHPFLMLTIWAAIISTTFYPVYSRLAARLGQRRSLAAALMVTGFLFVVAIPLTWIISLLASQASMVVEGMIAGKMPEGLRQVLENPVVVKVQDMLKITNDQIQTTLKSAFTFLANQSSDLFAAVFNSVFQFFLLLLVTYYFFKDGDAILAQVRKLLPLRSDQEDRILRRITDVIRATMLGNFVVMLLQGVLGGLVFAVAGIPSPVLWGTIMAFSALVPVLGTSIIWAPAAAYQLLSGETLSGVFIAAAAAVIMVAAQNFLMPTIIQGRTQLHAVVILFSIMGGITAFGFAGLILGPLVAALGFVFLEIYQEEFKEQLTSPEKADGKPESSGGSPEDATG